MRKLFVAVAVGVLAAAGQASAGTLSSASFSFTVDALPAATIPGAGATGVATSDLSASLDAGSAFAGTFTTTIPTSAAPPLTAVQVLVTKNAGGVFTGATPGNVGGNLAFSGTANVYGIGGFPGGGAPLLAVPLVVGTPNTISKVAGGVAITVMAGSWTAGTATVAGAGTTPTGVTVTVMGANGLTPGGAGTLVLVTPVKIVTSLVGTLAAFGTLTLSYVPEPGTLLLLGLGIAGLAALGGRRL